MSTFFTADTHFGHANIIKYCHRPFKDVEEMDQALVKNWNSVVQEQDTVYHLGDFAWGDSLANIMSLTGRLNGAIILVPGNHDPERIAAAVNQGGVAGFSAVVPQGHKLRVGSHIFVLSHYAMKVWERSHKGSYCLYGHTHGALPEDDTLSLDVGVDACSYSPILAEEVIARLEAKENRLRAAGKDPFDPWGVIASNPWDKSGETNHYEQPI